MLITTDLIMEAKNHYLNMTHPCFNQLQVISILLLEHSKQ